MTRRSRPGRAGWNACNQRQAAMPSMSMWKNSECALPELASLAGMKNTSARANALNETVC